MKKIKIKYSCTYPLRDWEKYTPSDNFTFNNCEFYKNDEDIEYDFWFVFETFNGIKEAKCNPQNTILLTGEPQSILVFNQKFMNQFNTLITPQQIVKHKNKINLQLLPWLIDKNYDELCQSKIPQKQKLISVIASNKCYTEGQRKRLELIQSLKEHFKDKMDIFGRGIKNFDNKWDVIYPYKYHITLENTKESYYCSEKLADAFLGYSYPFYWGCDEIKEYYPEDSYTLIDIDNPQKTIEIIENAISNNDYENKLNNVLKARNFALNKYNMFAFIAEYANEHYNDLPKQRTIIKSEWHFGKWNYFAQNLKKWPFKYPLKILLEGMTHTNTKPL